MTKVVEKIIQEAYETMCRENIEDGQKVSYFTAKLLYLLRGEWPLPIETLHQIVDNALRQPYLGYRESSVKGGGSEWKKGCKRGVTEQVYQDIIAIAPLPLSAKNDDANDEFGPSIGISRDFPEEDHNTLLIAVLIFFAIVILLYLIAVWD